MGSQGNLSTQRLPRLDTSTFVLPLITVSPLQVTYLNSVVMPDEPEEDSSEESDNDDEAGSSEIAE